MALFMKDNGKMENDTVKEHNPILKAKFIKEILKKVKDMVKEL